MIVPGGNIGEVVSKKGVEKQYQPVDTDTLSYCYRCNPTLTSDWKHPNEEDKKQLDKIRLKYCQNKNKDGSYHKFRFCPKCYLTVEFTKIPND
jgi:hypothetical protein